MPLFRPKEFLNKITDFDIEKYKNLGYTTILVDIDNTLAMPDVELTASDDAKSFINKLKENGFKIIIYSNNWKKRVKPFAESLDCDYVYFTLKPLPFVYWHTIIKYHLKKKQVLTLGDQIITDCIGANIVGFTPIYVKQLYERDTWKTKILRFFERIIFKFILHEKM